MKPVEIVYYLYQKEGIRNRKFLESILTDDFRLEWDSSTGYTIFNKEAILNFADDLKDNYASFTVSILNQVVEENKIALHYIYQASTIENPSELYDIAKMMIIWEFENDKIKKGYQFSKQF